MAIIKKKKDHRIQDLFSVKDKNIIVTGSNRGNGLSIFEGLKDAGANLIRIDKEFKNNFENDLLFDLSDISLIDEMIDDIRSACNKIDVLINNAGISMPSRNAYEDKNAYQKTMDVNLNSVFNLCSIICPWMESTGGGSIINITSLGAEMGFRNNPSYQISKAGLKQLTKSLAKDWGHSNIRVNNICPGYIKTNMTEISFSDKDMNLERKSRTMLGRWGEPKDLIGSCIFLSSEASSYITGSTIYVDGGWSSSGI